MAKKDLSRFLPYILIGGGLIGLLASFVLSVETFKLFKNPTYNPSCNLNPIISCGSVMKTAQADLFGFPNPYLGLISYSFITLTGVGLVAGATFKKWFWAGIQAIVTFSVIFIHWLLFESLYRIGSICPYCAAAWFATIAVFFYVTLHNLRSTKLLSSPVGSFIYRHHIDVLVVWYLLILILVLKRFWYYWISLI